MKMDTVFYVAHCLVYCGMVKEDFAEKPNEFAISRRYPLSLFVACILSCFSGDILVNFLLGEPPLRPLENHSYVLTATIVWYAMFYTPVDVIPKAYFFLPVKIFVGVLKEVHRTREIDEAVTMSLTLFPHSYFFASIIGAIKGSGPSHMKLFYRLACGVWFPEDIETMKPSLVTKLTLLGAVLFALDKKGLMTSTPLSGTYLYVSIATVFVVGLVLSVGFRIDPFEHVADAIRPILTLRCFWPQRQEVIEAKES